MAATLIENFIKNPITLKRIRRFKEMRRAYYSFWLLVILYGLSLGAELISNNNPLYIRFNGHSYFPVFKFYPENVFTGSEKKTRPDYHRLNHMPVFSQNENNYMIFPPVSYGPFESISPEAITIDDDVQLVFSPLPHVGTVNIHPDWTIARAARFDFFLGNGSGGKHHRSLKEILTPPPALTEAVAQRFENIASPPLTLQAATRSGIPVDVSVSPFSPRAGPPGSVRITFREIISDKLSRRVYRFDRKMEIRQSPPPERDILDRLPPEKRQMLLDRVNRRFSAPVEDVRLTIGDTFYTIAFKKEDVRFPYKPIKGHVMGLDGAGRDVFARILYGLRTSMTFGLLLVGCAMLLGIIAGALQGYYGGITDITAQRFIEIWSALPFLYIMILLGAVYGRSFMLLLVVYGLFNWIGISYYIRAEFLRLRKQPFVEAAKCMGISSFKIIFKHILPNGLIPVITFFPFSLVGAIGSLAALDYLGFGLPPPTPSWGELLFQAQEYRWAWWLILYPSLALFIVMLLGVFVGEGIRNAYDPKRYTRLEG